MKRVADWKFGNEENYIKVTWKDHSLKSYFAKQKRRGERERESNVFCAMCINEWLWWVDE